MGTDIKPTDLPQHSNLEMAWEAFRAQPHSEPLSLDSSSCPPNLCHGESLQDFFVLDCPNLPPSLIKHRESVSSSSGSSICEPRSPTGPHSSTTTTDSTVLDTDVDADSSEEPWNLIAYHIPWGPNYEGYKTGTLPGPDGTCVFLRSPTPRKRQRTSQACDKCRERKAKCSGTRPSCARCLSRGIDCVYGPSNTADSQLISHRLSHRRPSHNSVKPPLLKLSMRTHTRRKSSAAESEISASVASLQESNPDFTDMPNPATFGKKISKDLNEESSGCLSSLLGDDFESPSEPPTPSSFAALPESNLSSKNDYSAMLHDRAASLSDGAFTSLYTHPLSALDGYRFPPEDPDLTTPQSPPVASGFDFNALALLMEDVPVPNGPDVMWHETGFKEDSASRPEISFPDVRSLTNTAPYHLSDPSQMTFASHHNSVHCGLGDTDSLPAHFEA